MFQRVYESGSFRSAMTPQICIALLKRFPVGTAAQRNSLCLAWHKMGAKPDIDPHFGVADEDQYAFRQTRDFARDLGLALPHQKSWHKSYGQWWGNFQWPKADGSDSSYRPLPSEEERRALCQKVKLDSEGKGYLWVPDPAVDLLLSVGRPKIDGEFENYDPLIAETLLYIYNNDPLRLNSANGNFFFQAKLLRTSDEAQQAQKIAGLLAESVRRGCDSRILPMLVSMPEEVSARFLDLPYRRENIDNLMILTEHYPVLLEESFWQRFDNFPRFLAHAALQMFNESGNLRVDESVLRSVLFGNAGERGAVREYVRSRDFGELLKKYGWGGYAALMFVLDREEISRTLASGAEGVLMQTDRDTKIAALRALSTPEILDLMGTQWSQNPQAAPTLRKFLLDERVQDFRGMRVFLRSTDPTYDYFLKALRDGVESYERAGNGSSL